MLKQALTDDFKNAMKNKDELAKSVVTMLRSAIKQIEIDTRTELSDDEIVQIISKQIKQKKGAIEEFIAGGRQDLVEQAKTEIKHLEKYLPEQLSVEELKQIIDQIIAETGASSMKDMGKVVKMTNEKTVGRADSKQIADIVKSKLS